MRRMRRLPLEELQPYLLEINTPKLEAGQQVRPAELLDLATIFGNPNPVELEVGFGKGIFLVHAAENHPEINYLGIEIERAYQLYTANRLAKRQLKNVRLIGSDARVFLRDHVPSGSLQAVHVYFPDPWWKNRHRKRRLFNEAFAAECVRILRPGGHLYVASDVAEYFAVIQQLLSDQELLLPLPLPQAKEPSHDLDYLTNFERKYRKESRPIYRALYERGRED